MRRFAEQKPVSDITFHYTPEALAKVLINLVPIQPSDLVLDPSCGENKVFLKNFPTQNKLSCEIRDDLIGDDVGKDFLDFATPVDWAITNPPFSLYWKFCDHASEICRKGFAYLTNSNAFLSLTPRRLTLLSERGFGITTLEVLNIRKWFGRYYFVVFEKGKPSIIGWSKETW